MQATQPAEESLLAAVEQTVSRGERPLLLRSSGGALRLAVWRHPRREIEEIDLGSGPFTRPSRAGHAGLWASERSVAAAYWQDRPQDVRAQGQGLHEMPLGPVRADVAEALRYEMRCLGDEIFSVRLVQGFKRRGVERLMAGRTLMDALDVAERVTGTSPVAHALAYCLAVEDAMGAEVSERTSRQRVVLSELERLHSHLSDLAAIASSTGTPVAAAELYRLKDMVLRFNLALTGHRYLRGTLAPLGMRRPLAAQAGELRQLLGHVEREFSAIRAMLDRMTSFLDRLHGAGRVPADCRGLVGFVGRAAGRDEDVRWDRPYAAYQEIVGGRGPAAAAGSDAHARYLVRCEEVAFSMAVLRRLADSTGETPAAGAIARTEDGTHGWGIVEAPRGRLAYRVALRGGTLDEVRIATPSSINWPAVPAAVSNHNILQDFPIIDASFSLCVAALDL